ncbi:unnamed protein product [Schistosoma rodhaini]|uniref:MRP-L46 domain-containing protein n=1 Tax=Schistosoma mansoni TaxID=6183 RepID=A0A3Q0KPT5_SCHMA|nr:unnamed protein product [Schistosoma rodhaini]
MSRSLVVLKDIKNWNIFSGLCIRRPAVIAPELKPLEKQVADLLGKVEFERSHLSAHELRHETETKRIASALSKGVGKSAEESLITAREAEIMWELEAEQYKPAERLTENDKSENLKSAWRVLDKPLYLLVQSPKNVSSGWNLPIAPISDGKNLRQVADSIATSLLPSRAKWCIFGNTPVAVWLTADRNKEDTGTQIYFFNVYVDRHWHGEDLILNNNFNINNYIWVPRTELKHFVKSKTLLKTLKSFAIDY